LGVDGFRFDAAKHIELPSDTSSSCASDFWPTVINGIDDYTDNDLYCYGEILNSAGTDITNYTQYLDVTDNYTGDYALYSAYSQNSGALADCNYYKGADVDDSVLWVESHETFMGSSGSAGLSNTSGISDDVIVRAWAIVGSRADSTSLFFARPASTMGSASTDSSSSSTSSSRPGGLIKTGFILRRQLWRKFPRRKTVNNFITYPKSLFEKAASDCRLFFCRKNNLKYFISAYFQFGVLN